MIDSAELKKIFTDAIAISNPSEREKYLIETCCNRQQLRAEVEQLLKAHEEAGEFMEKTSPEDQATLLLDPQVAEQSSGDLKVESKVGPYTLLKCLGRGGMGAVYLAQQSEPVQRKVALKIIRAGMNTREVISRFESERQALALMDHQNIARVLDAGTTVNDQPYFAMELVDGIPITDFCDKHQLSITDRLDLFVSVCSAIQHAHQKGIVHRDIKPSNILVAEFDGKPTVKVIDFGVAKAIQQKLTDQTLATELGQIIGTLEYMSPEQAAANPLDVDTRSDIYSMGILLFELLTGTTPISRQQFMKVGILEVLKLIREIEPPRPSKRLTEVRTAYSSPTLAFISAARAVEPQKLSRILTGDLDWIVMKSLDKERNRRYQTASDLAADIKRYLNDEIVEACPPSAFYRFRKFAARNRVLLSTATLISIVLIIATTISSALAVVAVRERERAEFARLAAIDAQLEAEDAAKEAKKSRRAEAQQRERAEDQSRRATTVSTFLVDVFRKPDPQIDGRDIKLVDVLDDSVESVQREFKDQPVLRAELLRALGRSYFGLGLYGQALPLLQEAVSLFENEIGLNHLETIDSEFYLGMACQQNGNTGKAVQIFTSVVEKRESLLGDQHLDVLIALDHLGSAVEQSGDATLAEKIKHEAYSRKVELLGERHIQTVLSRFNLAISYLHKGDPSLAISMLEETLRDQEHLVGKTHPMTLSTINNLAIAYDQSKNPQKSLQLYKEVIKRKTDKLGPDHPSTSISKLNLAGIYAKQGKYRLAYEILEPLYELEKNTIGHQHPTSLITVTTLATVSRKLGERSRAISLMEANLPISRQIHGDSHITTVNMVDQLAQAYMESENFEKAIELFTEFVSTRRRSEEEPKIETLSALRSMAECYALVKNQELALQTYKEFLKEWKKHPQTTPEMLHQLEQVGSKLLKSQQFALAEQFFRSALNFYEKHSPDSWGKSEPMNLLALSLMGQSIVNPTDKAKDGQRLDEAQKLLQDAFLILESTSQDSPRVKKLRQRNADGLVHLFKHLGDVKQARKWLEIAGELKK